MRFFVYIGFFFYLLLACGTGEDQANGSQTSLFNQRVTFEKLDSIKIDYLGVPLVQDLDPTSKRVIFIDNKEFSPEIHVADFEGQILASLLKRGDVPDSYGALLAPLRIIGDSSFMAYSYNGFLTYDFNGKLQSRVKLKDFRVPNFSRNAMGFGMEKLGSKYLYIDQGSRNIDYRRIDAYNEMQLMNWLDPKTGEKEPFIQFPESSIFKSGKHFFRDSWAPAFTLADDKIYVIFGIEPVIYLYETSPPYSLLSNIPIDLEDYRYFTGSTDNSVDGTLRFTSGSVLNIKKVDGYFIIAYFPGYSSSDKEAENENKSHKENLLFRERMLKKYAKRIAILDGEGNRVSDFVPDGLAPESMLIRNNELWMLEKPDEEVEQDYFRLFRLELKIEQ